MWDPQSAIKPSLPALEGEVLATGQPGKSPMCMSIPREIDESPGLAQVRGREGGRNMVPSPSGSQWGLSCPRPREQTDSPGSCEPGWVVGTLGEVQSQSGYPAGSLLVFLAKVLLQVPGSAYVFPPPACSGFGPSEAPMLQFPEA